MNGKLCTLMTLLFCCGASDPDHLKLSNVHVRQIGNEKTESAKECASFSLTDAEASTFFSKAVIITSEQRHDYTYGVSSPCWVRGTADMNSKSVSWEIGVGGVADVQLPNGKKLVVADESQRESQE